MTNTYVFDTEAIIAYLYNEPGYATVESFLSDVRDGAIDGRLSETNAAEVFYLVARFEGIDNTPTSDSLRVADRDVRALDRWGLSLDRADWRLAAKVKADGHISLADAHAVALAFETDATLIVGADDDFDTLPIDVDIRQFRDESA